MQRRQSNPSSEGNMAIATETAQAATTMSNAGIPFADMSDVVLPSKPAKDPRR